MQPQEDQGREKLEKSPRKGVSVVAEAFLQHSVGELPQYHHLAIQICERKHISYMLQKMVAEFAVVSNFI